MSREVKRRHGSTADHEGFIGAENELTIDTNKRTAVIHDGATAGGFPLARADGAHSSLIASTSIRTIVTLFQDAYDSIVDKDPTTLYIILPNILTPAMGHYESTGYDAEFFFN